MSTIGADKASVPTLGSWLSSLGHRTRHMMLGRRPPLFASACPKVGPLPTPAKRIVDPGTGRRIASLWFLSGNIFAAPADSAVIWRLIDLR